MTSGTTRKPVPQNGAAIREIRQREGRTVTDLANAMQLSEPHIRNLECENKSARIEHIYRIAKYLNCRPSALMRLEVAEQVSA